MKKSKLKLQELKIESFVTELKDDNSETVKAGATPLIGSVTILLSIHEWGDNESWWHCPPTGAGGGEISDVIIVNNGVDACQWKEVIVEG